MRHTLTVFVTARCLLGVAACSKQAPPPPAAAPAASNERAEPAPGAARIAIAPGRRARPIPRVRQRRTGARVHLRLVCDSNYWREQLAAFDQKYTLVTVDLAGARRHRMESAPPTGAWRGFGQDVATALSAVPTSQKLILVGHSMGQGRGGHRGGAPAWARPRHRHHRRRHVQSHRRARAHESPATSTPPSKLVEADFIGHDASWWPSICS